MEENKELGENKDESKEDPEKLFTVCPVCGSPSIYQVLGMITGQHYKCPECNYSGSLVVEGNEKMVKQIREKYNKEKENQETIK